MSLRSARKSCVSRRRGGELQLYITMLIHCLGILDMLMQSMTFNIYCYIAKVDTKYALSIFSQFWFCCICWHETLYIPKWKPGLTLKNNLRRMVTEKSDSRNSSSRGKSEQEWNKKNCLKIHFIANYKEAILSDYDVKHINTFNPKKLIAICKYTFKWTVSSQIGQNIIIFLFLVIFYIMLYRGYGENPSREKVSQERGDYF